MKKIRSSESKVKEKISTNGNRKKIVVKENELQSKEENKECWKKKIRFVNL